MGAHWGRIRTTDGWIAMDRDSIRIDRSPSQYLRGQYARWRHGTVWDRTRSILRVILLGLLVVTLTAKASQLLALSPGTAAVGPVALFVLSVVPPWLHFGRETVVPTAAIHRLTLDPASKELTLTYEVKGRLERLFGAAGEPWITVAAVERLLGGETVDATFPLPEEEDVRDARATLRALELDAPVEILADDGSEREQETEYRVETEQGVVFCERCGSQVSPADDVCPACDYRLRVEAPLADGDTTKHGAEDSPRLAGDVPVRGQDSG